MPENKETDSTLKIEPICLPPLSTEEVNIMNNFSKEMAEELIKIIAEKKSK